MKERFLRRSTAVVLAVLMVLSVSDTGVYALSVTHDSDLSVEGEMPAEGELLSEGELLPGGELFSEGEIVSEDRVDDLTVDGSSDESTEEIPDKLVAESVSSDTVSSDEVFEEPAENIPDCAGDDTAVDMAQSGVEDAEGASDTMVVPSRYTLADNVYVSSVKDQGAWTTGWAFMSMAAAESAYMRQHPGHEINMSETQFIKYFFNGYYNEDIDRLLGDGNIRKDSIYPEDNVMPVMMGGNGDFSTFALARWTGAADEAFDPSLSYPSAARTQATRELNVRNGLAYDGDVEHLQNALWIDLKNRQDVKKAIMKYGTVGLAYYDDDMYGSDRNKKTLNRTYNGPAVYYNDSQNSSNHEAAVVGWDDGFDRNNFKNTYVNASNAKKGISTKLPSGNGAWLVKNSKGTGYGDNGFVWISYEDASLSVSGKKAYAFDFQPADLYSHNYQYDGSCYTDSKIYPYAAAIYKASGRQQIEAVGIGFASPNNEYTVSVYTDLRDPADPDSGYLSSEVMGSTTYPGFYTIQLDTFANVEAGSMFSVVVRSRTGNGGFTSYFVDSTHDTGSGCRFGTYRSDDWTFYRMENTDWVRSQSRDLNTLRIKAYSNDRGPEKKKLTNFTVDLPKLTYNGSDRTEELCKALLIMDGGSVLRDVHYSYSFDRTPLEAGKYTLTVTGRNDYEGKRDFEFEIAKAPLLRSSITLEFNEADYTGTSIRPAVYVNAGKGMSSDNNFVVSYRNNINFGTASVIVTGRNSFSGQAEVNFEIKSCPVTMAHAVVALRSPTYSGKPLTPEVNVTLAGKKLKKNKDYTVEYLNNINASDKATVRLKGIGNYSGVKDQKFTILPKKLTGIKVTGKAGTNEATVKYGNNILSPSCYEFAIYKGAEMARVDRFEATKTYTVIGKLKGNFTGSFTIKNVKVCVGMEQLSIAMADSAAVAYTRKALKPAVRISDRYGNIVPSSGYSLKYTNNVNVGTATVTATGKGLYTGAISTTFKITPAVITSGMITPVKDQKYAGKDITPKLNIKGLKLGRDYTCTYSNNRNVSYDNKGNVIRGAAITIRPSANYKLAGGYNGIYYFKILPVSISSVSAGNGYYRGEGVQVFPSYLKVKAGNFVLAAGDYTIRYSDNTSIKKKATVTVSVKSGRNFCGSRSAKYSLVREKLNSKTMKYSGLSDRKYTGSQIRPSITIVNSYGETLVNGRDYRVSYGKNIKPGKGTVKVTAIKNGRYSGSVTKNFAIVK